LEVRTFKIALLKVSKKGLCLKCLKIIEIQKLKLKHQLMSSRISELLLTWSTETTFSQRQILLWIIGNLLELKK
jgi:hypothetical protein